MLLGCILGRSKFVERWPRQPVGALAVTSAVALGRPRGRLKSCQVDLLHIVSATSPHGLDAPPPGLCHRSSGTPLPVAA
jgi:hypothetical protein